MLPSYAPGRAGATARSAPWSGYPLAYRLLEVAAAQADEDNGSTKPSANGRHGAVEEHGEFETLLLELSSRFVNLPAGEVDREIEESLRRVCEHLEVDSAVLWQWSGDNADVIAPTHAYSKPDGVQPFEPLNQDAYPWVVRQMRAGRIVAVSGLSQLPVEAAADRESARQSGIQSSLCLPLLAGHDEPVGALAFNTVRAERDWPDATVKRLQLFAQVFTNALIRRRADEALRTSATRLASAAELADLGFYELDYRGGAGYFDSRFRDLCGIPPDLNDGRLVFEYWAERLHPGDRERIMDAREQLHAGRTERLSLEYRYVHPSRGELWLHHLARAAVRDGGGRVVKTHGVLRDITARKQAEEALRKSFAEIERLKDRLQAESDYLKAEISVTQEQREITGGSAAIQEVLHQAEQVAPTDSTVLIRGETGTGKELLAQAIHRLSPRGRRVMVKVNCAALPSGLVESELFGREKGAFTGALARQVGRFEVADGSTLFLDEVGELPADVQVKLLRVLQEGEFERLGESAHHQGQRARDRGHQPRPRGGGPQGALPRGPLLPPQRVSSPDAAAARAATGHPSARLDLPRGFRPPAWARRSRRCRGRRWRRSSVIPGRATSANCGT